MIPVFTYAHEAARTAARLDIFPGGGLTPNSVRQLVQRHPIATYFVAAYALTWVVWMPRALVDQGVLEWSWPEVLGRGWSYAPAVAAFGVAAIAAGRTGVADLWKALSRWRVGWRWYALVLLAPFAVSWSAVWVHARLTGSPPSWPVQEPSDLLAYPLLLVMLALTDGVGEEIGWRGFALPHMEVPMQRAVAAALLGVLWAGWHLPLFWTHGAALEGRSFVLLLAALLPTSILFAWLFDHTGGSILLVVLLHATHNLAGPVLPTADEGLITPYVVSVVLKCLLAVAVLLLDPAFRPAPRTTRNPAGSAST